MSIHKSPYSHMIGKPVLVRTVTMIFAGILDSVWKREIVLKDAAWIADTGRYADCLKTGSFSEVEPLGDNPVIVGRGAIVDVAIIEKFKKQVQK